MALAAIIVSRQSEGYRRGSSNKVELAQDPYAQELAALHASAPRGAQQPSAHAEERLMASKARSELTARGPAINKLLEHSVELETRLASQEKAERQMAYAVQAAQRKVDRLKANEAKLNMVIGDAETDGDAEAESDDASIQAAGLAIASAYAEKHIAHVSADQDDDDGSKPLVASDMDNGMDAAAIKAAAAAIAKAYADRASTVEIGSADDWNGEALRPGKAQRANSRHGENQDDAWSTWQRREERMGFPTSAGVSPYAYGSARFSFAWY
jgi:uncharacterized coiled-coil protein SlyX